MSLWHARCVVVCKVKCFKRTSPPSIGIETETLREREREREREERSCMVNAHTLCYTAVHSVFCCVPESNPARVTFGDTRYVSGTRVCVNHAWPLLSLFLSLSAHNLRMTVVAVRVAGIPSAHCIAKSSTDRLFSDWGELEMSCSWQAMPLQTAITFHPTCHTHEVILVLSPVIFLNIISIYHVGWMRRIFFISLL